MSTWKRRSSWKHSLSLCIASIGLTSSVSAQQLETCSEVNSISGYKILLDDIRFNLGSTDTQDRQLMDLLKFQLGNRLENLVDEPAARYRLIRCTGRVPQGESSFPPLILQGLVNRDVVLEVWGEVFPASAGKHRVFLNYMMFPLPALTVSPFLQRAYQLRAGSSADDIVDWLANLNELSAYAMVARAVRLLNIEGPDAFDSAKADLKTASVSLRRVFGPTPSGNQKQLLAFLSERQCQILRDARTNSKYKGPLAHLPDAVVAQECPAGGVQ